MASENVVSVSKPMWKKMVWDKVWLCEREHWDDYMSNNTKCDLIKLVSPSPMYSIWWMISDCHQEYMRRCETMVRILCHTSLLKSDDVKLIRSSFMARSCSMCENAAYEDIRHIVMQCSAQDRIRHVMYEQIILKVPEAANLCNFGVLLGNAIEGWDCNEMLPIWLISCTYIVQMYYNVLRFRKRCK